MKSKIKFLLIAILLILNICQSSQPKPEFVAVQSVPYDAAFYTPDLYWLKDSKILLLVNNHFIHNSWIGIYNLITGKLYRGEGLLFEYRLDNKKEFIATSEKQKKAWLINPEKLSLKPLLFKPKEKLSRREKFKRQVEKIIPEYRCFFPSPDNKYLYAFGSNLGPAKNHDVEFKDCAIYKLKTKWAWEKLPGKYEKLKKNKISYFEWNPQKPIIFFNFTDADNQTWAAVWDAENDQLATVSHPASQWNIGVEKTWSPDGNWAAFISFNPDKKSQALCLLNSNLKTEIWLDPPSAPESRIKHRTFSQPLTEWDWSPDAKKLLIIWEGGDCSLYFPEQNQLKKLPYLHNAVNFFWKPDSQKVLIGVVGKILEYKTFYGDVGGPIEYPIYEFHTYLLDITSWKLEKLF